MSSVWLAVLTLKDARVQFWGSIQQPFIQQWRPAGNSAERSATYPFAGGLTALHAHGKGVFAQQECMQTLEVCAPAEVPATPCAACMHVNVNRSCYGNCVAACYDMPPP